MVNKCEIEELNWVTDGPTSNSKDKIVMFISLILLLFLILLVTGDDNNSAIETTLFESISQGDLWGVQYLIDTAGQINLINHQNFDGNTPLLWACYNGQSKIVEYFLNKGADVLISNDVSNGFTALHWASSNGFQDIVKFLIRFDANLEAKDFNGRTPLHLACERGNEALALHLIDAGSDIHAATSDMKTPLHYGAFSGMLRIVDLLINRGVDVNIVTKWEDTALHYAASGQTPAHTKIIQLLLSKGAYVDARGMQGDTPLHWACWKGIGPIAVLLAQAGADVHWGGRDDDGDTPFSLGPCESDPLRSQLMAAYETYNSQRREQDVNESGQSVCDGGVCSIESFGGHTRPIGTHFSQDEL